MSILSNDISTTSTALDDIKDAIIAKGVTPSGDITTYATAIGQISGGSANIQSLSVTPTTSAQTITASGDVDGYSPVNVSAVTSSIDANITAGNIKNGVTILGVTGNYSGSDMLPSYAISEGVVSKPAIELQGTEFSDIVEINEHGMYYVYSTWENLSGIASFPNLETIGSYGMYRAFEMTDITAVNMPKLTYVGNSGMYQAFTTYNGCGEVNLPLLEEVDNSGMKETFEGQQLLSFEVPSLRVVGNYGMQGVCGTNDSLSSIDVHSLEEIGNYGMNYAFANDAIETVTFTSLNSLGSNALKKAFADQQGALQSLYFPALTSQSFGNNTDCFNDMILDNEDVEVHFPSNLQAVIGSWQDVIDGFGGMNTTILFDLTATE